MLFPIYSYSRGYTATITGNISNLNLKTWLTTNTPWNGAEVAQFDITIDSAAKISATNTSNYALNISSFPVGCVINLINNGLIIGAGGAGGNGGGMSSDLDHEANLYTVYYNNATVGAAGGTAIYATSYLSIVNNNKIWGGGGGGGGSTGGAGKSGCGGGGGAGLIVGSGGSRGAIEGSYAVYGNNGNPGTETAGGSGGLVDSTYNKGGNGGGPGTAGTAGIGPYAGGAAGKYVVGNSYITWIATGDRRGGVS